MSDDFDLLETTSSNEKTEKVDATGEKPSTP